jgi:hypothetical protein
MPALRMGRRTVASLSQPDVTTATSMVGETGSMRERRGARAKTRKKQAKKNAVVAN